MTAWQTMLALVCAVGISVGQLLFKFLGTGIEQGLSLTSARAIGLAATSLAIYGVATVAWIYLLRFVPLTRAYPYMSLTFVIVPALSVMLIEERLSTNYFVGVALIVSGILLIVAKA
jgi:drug/metabolite transporter (DMT)-like permease